MSKSLSTPKDKIPSPPTPGDDWRSPMWGSAIVIIATLGVGGAWAHFSRLDGAVHASGVVAVETSRQVVQHLEGGIVTDILVRDGDAVKQGEVLFRIENSNARASAETFQLQLAAALIKEARLVAERDQLPEIIFPPEVRRLTSTEAISKAIADEQATFSQRRESLRFQIKLLEARIEQLGREIQGLDTEQVASREQLVFIDKELPGLRSLLARQLVQLPRVTALERERSRLEGILARGTVDKAKAEGSISEAQLQILQAQTTFQQTVANDIVDVRRMIGEVRERLTAAQDTMTRLEIRAPMNGIAQSRKVATRGAVVRPGDTLIEIAPLDKNLVVLAQVNPNDVDVLSVGMRAQVRFPNFKVSEVPVMFGLIRAISNDRVVEPGVQPYFSAEIVADTGELSPEIRARIRPGQNAEVVIVTGERSALAYLVQPMTERLKQAMRER
jgi:HlyD family secretion protein